MIFGLILIFLLDMVAPRGGRNHGRAARGSNSHYLQFSVANKGHTAIREKPFKNVA